MSIEVVSVSDGDEDEMVAPALAAKPALVLDEDGEVRKDGELPTDFPGNARPLADGSGGFLLTLEYPKTLNYTAPDGRVIRSEVFETLTLRRLNGKRYKAIQAATGTEMFRPTLLAQMADLKMGQARSLEDAMDAADFSAVMRVFTFFITPGRRTGT